MSTLSIPLQPEHEKAITRLIEEGVGSNKAEVVRRALEQFIEDQAVMTVLRAEQEVSEGKIVRGDLRKLRK